MHVLIAIALKSLFIAAAALGLLALMKRRSAAERSWVAHIGLLALTVIAFAPMVLPTWNVAAPALLGEAPVAQTISAPSPASPVVRKSPLPDSATPVAVRTAEAQPAISAAAVATALYALPAAILLLITSLALARLVTLRARADVLVDGHWLSALARAQRRMGFKHGTALLTSDDLASPISWGLLRPVILLNSRAVEAAGEAEAIIAHELAHVARLDWAKLMLARVAVALFWFNPLVWMLAREAHQFREEAADDAVLGANIADTDYAQLLVGVARHECSGLLLGAHGVAPSRKSLARRIARVLDAGSARGPVAGSFGAGVMVGALVVAAPLAALTLTPGGPKLQQVTLGGSGQPVATSKTGYYPEASAPADLPSIIANGVSASVTTAMAAVGSSQVPPSPPVPPSPAPASAVAAATHARAVALAQASSAVAVAREAAAEALADARDGDDRDNDDPVQRAIEMKAIGITPAYIDEMTAAAPQLRDLDPSEFVGMKAVGVTPDFAREWSTSGFRLDADELTQARAVGVRGSYVRAMINAGVRASFDDYVQLWAVGVRPDYVQRMRGAGWTFRNADSLVEAYTSGLSPADLQFGRRRAPTPPRPPSPVVYPGHEPDGG